MDANLFLRDGSANLTAANTTLTSVKVGPMTEELWLHVYVPQIGEVNDKLDVTLEFCPSTATTTKDYSLSMKQIAAAGHYAVPFITHLTHLQVKLAGTDADAGADLNFGGVKVWIDTASRYTVAN